MKKFTKLLTLAALIILCLPLAACGGTKLNLSDYLFVSFNGFDGSGTAAVYFDASQMELDYAGVKDGYPTQKQLKKMIELASFEYSVDYEMDKSDNLKNGDKITVTVTYGKEQAKEAKLNIGSTKKTFTVEGLKEPTVIDPFSPDAFEITGQNDYRSDGKVHIVWERDRQNKGKYAVSMHGYYSAEGLGNVELVFADSLSNSSGNHQDGDTVTVIATLSDRGVRNGYVLANNEYSFQIEVTQWPAGAADAPLSAEDLALLKKEANRYLQWRADHYWGYGGYEREDGIYCGLSKLDSVESESVYGLEDISGNIKLAVIAKVHVTEEYVSLVGANDADKSVYVCTFVNYVTKFKDQPIYFETNQFGNFEKDSLTKDGLLEILSRDYEMHEFN